MHAVGAERSHHVVVVLRINWMCSGCLLTEVQSPGISQEQTSPVPKGPYAAVGLLVVEPHTHNHSFLPLPIAAPLRAVEV